MIGETALDLQPGKRTKPPNPPQQAGKGVGGNVLSGLRVLIVEDEFLVGLLLEDDLKAKGSEIIATCRTLAEGNEAARNTQFDIAILDINLNGEMVFPLADLLIASSKPLVFLSGYIVNLPERFGGFEAIAKPYQMVELENAIGRAMGKTTRTH